MANWPYCGRLSCRKNVTLAGYEPSRLPIVGNLYWLTEFDTSLETDALAIAASLRYVYLIDVKPKLPALFSEHLWTISCQIHWTRTFRLKRGIVRTPVRRTQAGSSQPWSLWQSSPAFSWFTATRSAARSTTPQQSREAPQDQRQSSSPCDPPKHRMFHPHVRHGRIEAGILLSRSFAMHEIDRYAQDRRAFPSPNTIGLHPVPKTPS